MYFKQIEMLGFKSFADRTHLNLDAGITAIVGPNGCGKSNILDALRWSLGEQSAKALRGAHMQDVIFNGSEHRSPTGMAEVTLTFDNADGKLPLDFAEIQVTRRVYRSGESEYCINKAPCRLRDIQDMFMDTGIGTNAYSLIGQGKIDLVLSSKPEDRRYLFEEAAGIIKYKSRKRVAMRKLESAEQNLLRLNDIIQEVQRQMRALKRQVNAAMRHRELSEALRELEIRNAWLHFNELTGEIQDLQAQYTDVRDLYQKQTTECEKLDAHVEAQNLKRIELERELMNRREGEHQVNSELERLENQIALLRKEIDFARNRGDEALKEREELLEKANSLQHTQGETDEQATSLGNEIMEAQQAFSAKQEEYNEGVQKADNADKALEQIRTESIDTLNQRNRAQTELETIGVGLQNIAQQLSGIYDRETTQNARLNDLQAQVETGQKQHDTNQLALTNTVEKRQAAQEDRKKVVARVTELNDEWQNLREKKSSQEARLNSLRELRDSYEGFAVGVRAIMKAKQHNMREVSGVIGPVGDLLSTEKEYGQAIEAALGGNVNNVVVDQAEDAKSAIGFLKEHRAGRVTFLPLDTIRSSNRDDSDTLQGYRGVVGKAINFVQCESRIMPALEYLLYNTVIVETIDDAIHIARKERRFPRLVTLDGEVVSSAGAVTGGRTRNDNTGLLGRTAEIEELERSVDAATKRVGTLMAEAQQLTTRSQALAQEINNLEELEQQHRQALNESGVALARLTTELDSLTQSGQQLGQSRDSLVNEQITLESRKKAVEARILEMEQAQETFIQREISARESVQLAKQALAQLGNELADLRVQLASLNERVEEAQRNRIREQHQHQEIVADVERRLALAQELEVKVKDLEAGVADNIDQIKALSESKEEAHALVLDSQKDQQVLLDDLESVNKRLKKLREELSTSQKKVHTLELALSQREDRVTFFQERILEEYNLALASLTEDEVGQDEYDEDEREKLIQGYRKELQKLGNVNLMAIEEYEALEQREQFLLTQDEDLKKARQTLLDVVERIDETIKVMFMQTFNEVGECFKNYFRRLFNGGQARVYLVDENDPLESGIEIEARPPGKKPQSISLLSGGEQAMTAIALLFSIFKAKPSPFCVLDEVDAPLDDANIGRFLGLVDEFTDRSQFIIITHNKQTMARANALFGVTQQERGVSQLVSVLIDEMGEAGNAA